MRAVLYGAAALAFAAAYAIYDRPGRLEAAFRSASRDSFATDVTDDIARVLPLGKHLPQADDLATESGFICHRTQLVDRKLWTCQRWAFRFTLDRIGFERWTLEFECDGKLAHCTIVQMFAGVR